MNGGGVFHLQPRDLQAEQILANGVNNPNISRDLQEAYLKAMFESSRTYGLFTMYFDEEFYHYVANYYNTHTFGRERPMYSVIGIARLLEDVEISQRNHSPYRDMQRYLEQDFALIHNEAQIGTKLALCLTARIDVNLLPTKRGELQIVSLSDEKATVNKSGWLSLGQSGYFIQSYAGNLKIIAKTTADGQISLYLRGVYILDSEDRKKCVPYWIDYTKLTINDKLIFDTLTPAWHNKPFSHKMDVKAGEEIKIQVEWLPHRSDT